MTIDRFEAIVKNQGYQSLEEFFEFNIICHRIPVALYSCPTCKEIINGPGAFVAHQCEALHD